MEETFLKTGGKKRVKTTLLHSKVAPIRGFLSEPGGLKASGNFESAFPGTDKLWNKCIHYMLICL